MDLNQVFVWRHNQTWRRHKGALCNVSIDEPIYLSISLCAVDLIFCSACVWRSLVLVLHYVAVNLRLHSNPVWPQRERETLYTPHHKCSCVCVLFYLSKWGLITCWQQHASAKHTHTHTHTLTHTQTHTHTQRHTHTYTHSLTHTHTHTHTQHTHTHTQVCFCELWGLSICVMVFILYKLYFLSAYI